MIDHQEDAVLRGAKGPALAALVAASMIGVAFAPAAGLAAATASHTEPKAAAGGAADRTAEDRPHAGPPYEFTTELMGEHMDLVLRDMVMLTRTEHGYRYWSGNHKNHIRITRVDGGLRFRDTGTQSFKRLAPSCERRRVNPGIAAVCRIPSDISVRWPLLVEVWPRLGNDYVDASTLSSEFAVTVLADGGIDVVHLGAGPDFFNGHTPRDRVWGGAGDDWIRAGRGNDYVEGGSGNDDLVAMQGRDNVYGGDGDDRIGGSEGDDRLWGNAGADFLLCGTGSDSANVDSADRVLGDCETVNH
jgi:hypothetical protein